MSDSERIGVVDLNDSQYHQNGILLFGLIGGFSLATVVILLTQYDQYVAFFANRDNGIAYTAFLVTLLGVISFWSIGTSLLMVVIGSAKKPEEWENITHLTMRSLTFIVTSFGVLLATLIAPLTGPGANLVVISSIVFALLFARAWWKDEKNRRKKRMSNPEAQSKSATKPTQPHPDDENPPAAT